MKKSNLAIFLTLIIVLSCAFGACGTADLPPDGQGNGTGSSYGAGDNYSSLIKELEDQIIELKQDQYISESKRTQEIARLESLIMELKQTDTKKEESSEETRPSIGSADSEKDEHTQTDTDTHPDTESSSPTGKFTYTVNEGKATITGFTGKDSRLVLPSSIDGYAVTCIADDAFNSDTLEEITVPEGVTKIGWFAFKECSALRSVTLPNSVTSIGYSAFPANRKGFTIICHADSFAAAYAQSYGISFTTI